MSERALRALYLNCSLKKDPSESHTRTLIEHSMAVVRAQGVEAELVHALEHSIAFGMAPDMREDGWPDDGWPGVLAKVKAADILVLGTPIWLGVKSSVCTQVLERLYASSSEKNDHGQYLYYGKVGGCLVTGNEDGIKACSMEVLYALQHIGFTVPPASDAGWIGEAGPGASYGDEEEGRPVPVGFDNEFTNRNTTTAACNLVHMARLLREAGGFPRGGNVPAEWERGERQGYPLDSDGRPAGD